MSLGSLKSIINKMCLQIIYLIYMNKEDLALNNLQWLYAIKINQTKMELLTQAFVEGMNPSVLSTDIHK